MPKIRMLRASGKRLPWQHAEGEIVDADQAKADALINAGLAVLLPGEVQAVPPPQPELPPATTDFKGDETVEQATEELKEAAKPRRRRAAKNNDGE